MDLNLKWSGKCVVTGARKITGKNDWYMYLVTLMILGSSFEVQTKNLEYFEMCEGSLKGQTVEAVGSFDQFNGSLKMILGSLKQVKA